MILKLDRFPTEDVEKASVKAPPSYSSASPDVLPMTLELEILQEEHIEDASVTAPPSDAK
jgi:hypothetical protein